MQTARIILLGLISAYFAVALLGGKDEETPPATVTAQTPALATDWQKEFTRLWAQVERHGYVVAFEPWPSGGGGLLMVYNSGTLIASTSAPYERLVLTLERMVK
jgi:hypothetical protein